MYKAPSLEEFFAPVHVYAIQKEHICACKACHGLICRESCIWGDL